jgi:mannose-1-phosphate guanylyltransferase
VQPENKETAPGLLLPLMHLAKRYPNSTVVVFPSDHFVLEEEKLMSYVRLAHLFVKKDPSRLVLLGIEPDQAEPEYGYILPQNGLDGATGALRVSCFIEKPDYKKVPDLILKGALWNTMVMVFKTDTFLNLVRDVAPDLYSMFRKIHRAIGTLAENPVVRAIYQQLRPVNFSKELLEPYVEAHPSSLLAIPVRDVLWSDWGTESRIMEVLRRTGHIGRLNGLSLALRESINAGAPASRQKRPAPAKISQTKNTSARSRRRRVTAANTSLALD